MKYVTEVIERLQNQCGICWCLGHTEDVWHEVEDCLRAEFFLVDVSLWKKKNAYGKNDACVACSVPGDLCPRYCEGLTCVRKDVVIPVCLIIFTLHNYVGMKIIRELASREMVDVKDYHRWLIQGRRVCGLNCTNAFAVFEWLCRELR